MAHSLSNLSEIQHAIISNQEIENILSMIINAAQNSTANIRQNYAAY